MTKEIQIFHPKSGEMVHGPHIAAQGIASGGVVKVKGILIDNVTGHVIEGREIFPAPRWVILFRNLKVTDNYTLVILELDPDGTIASSSNVKVTGRSSVQGTRVKLDDGGLTLTYPNSTTTTVSAANFAPYGTTSQNGDQIIGSLNIPGAMGTPFTATTTGSQDDWVIQYNPLQTGNNATMNVVEPAITAATSDPNSFAVK